MSRYPANWRHQPYEHLELGSQLPRLPIPSLEVTLERYLVYLKPLLTPEQWQHTARLVQQFGQGEGPALQAELRRLDRESPTSWLEGFWDAWYVEPRCALPINVNPAFMWKDVQGVTEQVERAALIVHASASYYNDIRTPGRLPVDRLKNGDPLCMTQYGRLFATWRVPKAGRDEVHTVTTSRHVAVLAADQVYRLEVLTGDGCLPSTLGPTVAALRAIAAHAATMRPTEASWGAQVGQLSAQERNQWAADRAELVAHCAGNAAAVEALDTALFVLCLDDEPPQTLQQANRFLLHGESGRGGNRWYDKLNVIVFPDASAGINMEHTPLDGTTMVMYLNYVHAWSREHAATSLAEARKQPSAQVAPYKALPWRLSPALHRSVASATSAFRDLYASMDLSVLQFAFFGKTGIVGLKCSPDSFVQVCFQLTVYAHLGRVESTYESVQTKRFYHGRTECARCVTDASLAACEQWAATQNGATAGLGAANAIRAAISAQSRRASECSRGQGVERHLFGLLRLAQAKRHRLPGYELPEALTDASLSKLMTSVISTSNCGSSALQSFSFGPVTGAGFGLGYIINKGDIVVCVTSFRGQATAFARRLEATLLQAYKVLQAHPAAAKL